MSYTKVENKGILKFRTDGHTLQDCISLVDETGMGLVMSDFSQFEGKEVRLIVVSDGEETHLRKTRMHGTESCPCLCHYVPHNPGAARRHPNHCSECDSSSSLHSERKTL